MTASIWLYIIIIIIEPDLHCSYNIVVAVGFDTSIYVIFAQSGPFAYLIVWPALGGFQTDLMTTLSIYPIRQIKVSRVFHYVRCSILALPTTSMPSLSSFICSGRPSPLVLVVNLRLLDAYGRKLGLGNGYLVGQVVRRGYLQQNAQRIKWETIKWTTKIENMMNVFRFNV